VQSDRLESLNRDSGDLSSATDDEATRLQVNPLSGAPDRGARRWASKLLALAIGLLLYLVLSGLVIYLAPLPSDFMESQGWAWKAVQWQVLLHTVLGLVAGAIISRYLWKHYFSVMRQRFDWGRLLGHLSFWMFFVCGASGLVLTWQAWFGSNITYWIDTVHTWSGFVMVPLLGWHLFRAWVRVRRRATLEVLPLLRSSQWRLAAGSSAAAGLLLVIGAGFALSSSGPEISTGVPVQEYGLKYGQGPFLPSNVNSSTGSPINADVLAGSENCGSCHKDIYDEWKASAHSWSASDMFFRAVASAMEGDTGIESTRYCGGCHNPISILSGSLTAEVADALEMQGKTGQEAPHSEEGISCTVCHGITEIQGSKGNANYEFTPPPRYLFELEDEDSLLGRLSSFLIRAYPQTHKESLSKAHYKLPEYCGTCHKQYLDESVNNFGWVRLQNQLDNWKESKWNQGPGSPETIVCIECHMPLTPNVEEASSGVSDGDPFGPHPGQHRNHRWLAANQAIPWLLEEDEQVNLTEKWLKGEYLVPEIQDKWLEGPAVATDVAAPESVQPAEAMEYSVVIANRKVGHEFPTGPLDLIQTWIETKVEDASGRTLFHSGWVGEDNYVDPDAHYFRSFPIDEEGDVIYLHNLWDMVGTTYVRVIFPGFSEKVNYAPDVPEDVAGPLTISANLRMRKFHQKFVDVTTDNSGLTFPITDLSSSIVEVELVNQKTGRAR